MKLQIMLIVVLLACLVSCKKQSRFDSEYPKHEIESICQKTSLTDFLKLNKKVTVELDNGVVAHQIYSYPPFLFIKNYRNLSQYLYDTRSKKMVRIGDVGKGPGEYVYLASIAFLSPHEFYGLGSALKRINKYRLDGENIICEDTLNINTEYGVWVDEIFYKNGNLYCNSFSGPAGTYQVVVYDNEMNIVNKFHKRRVESSAVVPVSLFYMDMIIFLSEYNYEQKKHHDSFIYIYSLNGDLLSKIDTHEHDLHELLIDKTGKYIFAVTEDKAKIFTIDGDLIHEVKRDQELRPDCNPALRFMRTGKRYDDIIYGFQTDQPNVYQVNIYSCEIEEGTE